MDSELWEYLGPWAETEVLDNRLGEWVLAVLGSVLVSGATRALQAFLTSRLEKGVAGTKTRADDIALSVLESTKVTFHLTLGLLVARHFVTLPEWAETLLTGTLALFIGIQCGIWAQSVVGGAIAVWSANKAGGQEATLAAGLRFLARLVIWTLVLLVVLSNLGVELSAVIAGLGVGGVAAALAVQSILGDLIAGVSMYFDRPFDIGDFVIVGDYMGSVRKIGIRTTRLASLGGEEIIMPNGELVASNVRNYARMVERRIVFAFGIEYNLPATKVERARVIATEVIQERDGVRFDRVHFKAYGESSLDFEAVYYVLSPDFTTYMDHQHAINMAIYRRFEEDEIPFAFPSRTVYWRGAPAREVS